MTLAVFLSILAIHIVAAMSPGPSFVVSVKTAAAEGFRPAAGLAFGFGLGAVIWALSAMFGLALMFEIFPAALTAFKVAGGLFLLWLGITVIRHASAPLPEPDKITTPRSAKSAFLLGLMTQLSNPKPAVFFGAVFAGLIPPGTPMTTLALLMVFVFVNETIWYLLVARAFSSRRAQSVYAGAKNWTDRVFGGLIGAFGLKIALT